MSDWRARAACAGLDNALWFPSSAKGSPSVRYGVAREICMSCRVRESCLEEAMVNEGVLSGRYRFGMYGGLTPYQRRVLRGKQQRARRIPPAVVEPCLPGNQHTDHIPVHGRVSTYRKGCDCPQCMQASADARQRYRLKETG